MNRTTQFSICRQYRYTLWREWDCDLLTGTADDLPHSSQFLQVIALNPSTADETKDDPTIRRCIDFAKRWGFGALCMTNLFAWRDTLPANMKKAEDPIGPDNDQWLTDCAKGAGLILAAWGKHGSYLHRADLVVRLLARNGATVHCLRTNGDGSPQHPLYIPADTLPKFYGNHLTDPTS